MWQGIRNWFRPVGEEKRAVDPTALSSEPTASSATLDSSREQALGLTAMRASTDSTADEASGRGAEIMPFPGLARRDTKAVGDSSRTWEGGSTTGISEIASEFAGSDGAATLEGVHAPGVDETELLDFLAADLDPIPADPVFREKLRNELWDMVASGGALSDDDADNR